MPEITLTIGGTLYNDVEAGLARLTRDIEEAFEEGVARAAPTLLTSLEKVSAEMVRLHGNPWSGGPSGDKLQRRSGDGLKSLVDTVKVAASRGEVVAIGEIGGGKLSFHEEGGTIRAKRAKYLTIPLPAALDPRGVPLRERARQWDNTFVKRSRRGNLIIFRKTPGARELTPLYILKTSVTIRPRLRLEPTLLKELSYFENALLDQLDNAIDRSL